MTLHAAGEMEMVLIIAAVVAGAIGTAAMDLGNWVAFRLGLVHQVSPEIIGRMISGWATGRFVYASPAELPTPPDAARRGLGYHYLIGVTLAVPFVVTWWLLTGAPPGFVALAAYGLSTSVISIGFMFPSLGLGPLGLKAGLKQPLTSLYNHALYGVGLWGGVALVTAFRP